MDFSKMTLREKIYQTFVTYPYHISKEGSIENFFKKHPCGGVYFARGVVKDVAKEMESRTIVESEFIRDCRAAVDYPLLVCADGANMKGHRGCVGSPVLAAAGDMQLAYDAGRAMGMMSNHAGVDVLMSPTIDMALSGGFCDDGRQATDDPELNEKLYRSIVRGIQAEGVAAMAKHFPGQSAYFVNCHYGPSHNTQTMEEWEATNGRCYRAIFEEGCMCVMNTHYTLKAWSDKSVGGRLPIASYSEDINMGLLKGKLGFKGVLMTDALTMGGMASSNAVEDAMLAFKAGADLLLWPPMEAVDRIAEEIENGNIPMSRLDDALSRIQYLRDFLKYEGKERNYKPADTELIDRVYEEAVARASTVVRNKLSTLPLSPAKQKKLLVVGCGRTEGEMKPLHEVVNAFKKRGFEVDFREYLLTCWEDEMREIHSPYDALIICYNVPVRSIEHYPEVASTTWSSHLVPDEKAVFLNFGSQHLFDQYFPAASTFVNTNTFGVNPYIVEEVVARLCGEKEFEGKTTVKFFL